ncbi:MAG: 1-deoxy-D-xylulose-5-phosphate synthase N-terminal domain-containing protein [Tagaea sp.]
MSNNLPKPFATPVPDRHRPTPTPSARKPDAATLAILRAIERKVVWLSSWTIHNANQIRPKRDGLKVGGHQASSASMATLMTALYLRVLRPQDRVAVKPHASPVFHALQYLLGHQTREKLERFRALGGAQAYPSRTKDIDDVDFSTGSVGLGVAETLFASIAQDYARLKDLHDPSWPEGRMIALVGDAEFDEGNVFEAMLEGWKHDVRNLWWIIDYNRQSLDSTVSDKLFQRIVGTFESIGWRVIVLKYGKALEAAFAGPGGDKLRAWIDDCPNSLYSALVYKGGAAWREYLTRDLGDDPGIRALLARHNDDDALARLMTNLAGHDMESVLEAYDDAATTDLPTVIVAYTIKGHGLPFAGHKDNHAGLMSAEQMDGFRAAMGIAPGREWEKFEGLDQPQAVEAFLRTVPFAQVFPRRFSPPAIPVPADFPAPRFDKPASTQEGFGRVLFDLAGGSSDLAKRIVTTSPDVTVSTNLGGWVNRRGIFDRHARSDTFKSEKVVSAQLWNMNPQGQHVELGIAEHNLFLMLGALGLAGDHYGARLLPVGTLYDPFVNRGLDALTYACYQDSRFMVVATPSGVTLAPEGGAHQSVGTPLVGMGAPNLLYFEPAFVDELAEIMRWGFGHLQSPEGGSLYLRLSTRPLVQPGRDADAWRPGAVEGGYWLVEPARGAELAVAYCGPVAPEARAAFEALREEVPGAGLLAVTSPDRLHRDWRALGAGSPIARLLAPLAADAALVSVLDGHPATLSWLGAVRGQVVRALGVEGFGQSADIPDIYAAKGLDAEAIQNAAAAALVARARA